MNDVKFYEFLLKLNTYLQRSNILADKFANQELELRGYLQAAQSNLPKKTFDAIFNPMVEMFTHRVAIMNEIVEANDEFEKMLHQYCEYFKGTIQ